MLKIDKSSITYTDTEHQLLVSAQDSKPDPSTLLNSLNIEVHPYTLYVVEYILFRNKDTAANVLVDLKLVNGKETLDLIGAVANQTILDYHDVGRELMLNGVKYLDRFLVFKSDLIDEDAY